MDLQKLRAIAGLPSVKSTAAISRASDAVLESSDVNFIVSSLKTRFAEYSNVNVKIYDSIKEYLQTNADATNTVALKEALARVSPKASFEQANSLRKMAGLPPLTEKKDEDEDEVDTEESDSEEDTEESDSEEDKVETDDSAEEEAEDEQGAADKETNDVAALVASIASKLLKDGPPEEGELTDFLMKVYQAGAADGAKSAS